MRIIVKASKQKYEKHLENVKKSQEKTASKMEDSKLNQNWTKKTRVCNQNMQMQNLLFVLGVKAVEKKHDFALVIKTIVLKRKIEEKQTDILNLKETLNVLKEKQKTI